MFKRLVSTIKLFIFTILILVVTTELLSLIAVKLNLLLYNKEPGYLYPAGDQWRTETMPWGAWHKPNVRDRHKKTCFDITYESNNLGARDNEIYDENLPSDSIILIGDSFAEATGVQLEETFAEVLEKGIGRKVLNFGSAAFFGPVQEEILYNNLASKLPHNEIIYFFLPSNDFFENDRRYWKSKFNRFRHRPYFRKTNNNEYEVFYPNEKIKSKFLTSFKSFIFHRLQVFLLQYTYTANVLRSINAVYAGYNNEKNVDTPSFMKGDKYNYGYFFDDHEAIDGSLYFSKKLLSKASNLERRLIIIIPEVRDLIEIYNGRDYKNLKWYLDLKRISSQTNSILFDLADHFTTEDYEKMVHTCDGHWSVHGNSAVAKLIEKNFF